MNRLNSFEFKLKQGKATMWASMVYAFAWSICKILFGVFSGAYFFCVSGASNLLFAFVKKLYLHNFEKDDKTEKQGKSVTISILMMISGVLFTIYMARLFFVDDIQQYGLIMSITIATASFVEFGLSIFYVVKASKTTDLLLQSFRGCNLISSCYAIVLTQTALLSATNTQANDYNAITGIMFGLISIGISIIYLINSCKKKI